MRVIVLGGAGIIGRAIARDLVRDVDEVLIADLDENAAMAVAQSLGRGASWTKVDVTAPDRLAETLSNVQVCVNSVNYYFNLEVMRACLASGVPYVDLGGLFHMTRRQLELHGQFERQGVTAILGLGSCPGVANVQAGWLAGMLESVDSVRIYTGSTQDEGESLAAPYAIQTILDELSMPAMIFRNREFQERPPLGEEEYFTFPDPIGRAKTRLSLHSEVATIPISLADKGIRECSFKITTFGFAEPALRKLQFLVELGLASTEPMQVDGASVRPRALLLQLLGRLPQPQANWSKKTLKAVVTEVRGKAAGQEFLLRAETTGPLEPSMGDLGGSALVAGPPAIAARWLGQGKLARPGVWPPEQIIEPVPFFEELATRGFTTRLIRTQTVAPAGPLKGAAVQAPGS